MFQRLIRFKDSGGTIHFGELGEQAINSQDGFVGEEVDIYKRGVAPWDDDFQLSGERAQIKEVLCPLQIVPLFLGVGLNYKQHAHEANFPIPEYPLIFTKPADALAGPFDDIEIPEEAKNTDYEGEFCVIIGRDIKDLPPNASIEPYILGYTVGNDVSSRYWQAPERCGSQHGYAKSFDSFAPIGPVVVSPHILLDYTNLTMTTRVNGEERQTTKLDDMIFSVEEVLRHLSKGRTVRRGTVVMTGTPIGVGAFMKPPQWLKKGDVVEVELEGVGRIRNRFF